MECKFTVGQKVVCVDAARRTQFRSDMLKEGAVYTVVGLALSLHKMPVVQLAEVAPEKGSIGFQHSRFRPVKTTQTDISVFTEIVRREFDVDKKSVKEVA